MKVRRRELVVTGFLAVLFGAAPTVGDVGSCGKTATDLDLLVFAGARKRVDCQRCGECGVRSQSCGTACDPNASSNVGWPATCHPLEHDGEVCLRALRAASCRDYAHFVDDVAPTLPTECDFCHLFPEAGVAAGDP
ncbi:MAG: hypothetical protein M3O46_02030 [Myxococcota bacterium]|nr:hypothetical protein [Myxococcota bacterium]